MVPDSIERALDNIECERRSIRKECDAFDRFQERIRPLSIESRTVEIEPATPAAVLETYSETVAGTADYECVYDESVEKHLANELGEDIAERLQTAEVLDDQLKRELLSTALQARERREGLLRMLETEEASVTTARCELTTVRKQLAKIPPCSMLDQPLSQVIDRWRTLNRLASKCEEIIAERQRYVLNDRPTELQKEPFAFDEYLYDELETIHPVISSVATTVTEIHRKQATGFGIDEHDNMTA